MCLRGYARRASGEHYSPGHSGRRVISPATYPETNDQKTGGKVAGYDKKDPVRAGGGRGVGGARTNGPARPASRSPSPVQAGQQSLSAWPTVLYSGSPSPRFYATCASCAASASGWSCIGPGERRKVPARYPPPAAGQVGLGAGYSTASRHAKGTGVSPEPAQWM